MALLREIRQAARSLARTKAFTAVVVATLALGIGANSAIFGIVNAVLLRPLGYPEQDRLAVLWETRLSRENYVMFASPPNFADWRARQRGFEDIGAFAAGETFLVLDDATVRLDGARVSAALFDVLRVQPLLGRGFTEADDAAGAERVAILSHRLWQDRFGEDRSIIGSTLTFDDGPRTIIGVMPAGFDFPPPIDLEGPAAPRRTDVWVPFAWDHAQPDMRGAHFMTVVGRLAEGATLVSAERDLKVIAADLARAFPETNDDWSAFVVPFEEVVVGNARTALLVLLGAVGAVLLIACVNIANLLLARSAARQKEYAIRASLGAGRLPLVRQAVVESQLLAITGGAAGLLLAYATLGALVRIAPANVPRLEQASIDPVVIGFTVAISIATGLLFGVVPAVRALSPDLAHWLRQGARGGGGEAKSGARDALVIAEVALSLVLLVGAGLLFNSFLGLRGVDTGFRADNVLTMQLSLSRLHYPEPDQVVRGYAELERRIAAIPGVEAAGFSRDVPLAGDYQGTDLLLDGEAEDPQVNRSTHFSIVTPGYFAAMGIPIVAGRGFEPGDAEPGPGPVLVNSASSARYFGGRPPLGRSVTSFGEPRPIIGVVGDVRLESLSDAPTPALYFLHSDQRGYRNLSLVVRSAGPPASVLEAVTGEIRSFDPRIPVYNIRTLDEVVAQAVAQPRFSTTLLVIFSGLALALAALGIYGVVSYAVGQRTRELGVRMALGARPWDALRLVLASGMRSVGIGILIGLVAALWLTQSLRSLLYEISPTDPVTIATVCVFLLAVAVLACWVPARRASRVDPVVALRAE